MKRLILLLTLSLFVCVTNAQRRTGLTKADTVSVAPQTISLNGGKLTYSCKVHPSVGYTFKVEFDKDAFTAEILDSYKEYMKKHPEERGMCGGDRGTLTYTLHPKKKGKFTIYEVEGFRGKETKRTKHIIIVK